MGRFLVLVLVGCYIDCVGVGVWVCGLRCVLGFGFGVEFKFCTCCVGVLLVGGFGFGFAFWCVFRFCFGWVGCGFYGRVVEFLAFVLVLVGLSVWGWLGV